jgi:hypothetical protein
MTRQSFASLHHYFLDFRALKLVFFDELAYGLHGGVGVNVACIAFEAYVHDFPARPELSRQQFRIAVFFQAISVEKPELTFEHRFRPRVSTARELRSQDA